MARSSQHDRFYARHNSSYSKDAKMDDEGMQRCFPNKATDSAKIRNKSKAIDSKKDRPIPKDGERITSTGDMDFEEDPTLPSENDKTVHLF